jgi:hypothetical protein
MARIKSNENSYEIARRALSWIHFAKRLLSMPELREAIAIEPIEDIENEGEDCGDVDEDSLVDAGQIIECCGSLISCDPSTQIVTFSHYTVSEFFRSNANGNIEPELYVTRACLTYLCFDIFSQETINKDLIPKKYQLIRYIAQFLGHHIVGSEGDHNIQNLVLSILWSPAKLPLLGDLEVSEISR